MLDRLENATMRPMEVAAQLRGKDLTGRDREAWRILQDELESVDAILGAVPFRADRARCERTLAAAGEALDAEAFAVAHGRGRAMGWREAVELALSVGSGESEEAATPRGP